MDHIELTDFDQTFYESIPQHEEAHVREGGTYYTILVDGVKAGIVGFLPGAFDPSVYFVQVAIAPAFRGRGLAGLAEDLLAKNHHLPALTATIEQANSASIKSHLKSGFTELPEDQLHYLRKREYLKETQTRLVKEYSIA